MAPLHDTPSATPRETSAGTLTLKAAAEHVGVSASTLRRRRDALIAAGAFASPSGWSIPVSALEAVFGDTRGTPAATPAEAPPATPSESDLIDQLRSENAFLRQQVEQQTRTIERQAEAHAVISAQLTRLGQLGSGTETATADEPDTAHQPFWKKLFRR